MANPPPARPWFRLTSIRPIPAPAPAPAPAPESRPTLALPTFRTASAPPSPQSTTHSTQSQEKREQPPPPPPSSPPKVFPSSSSSSLPSSPIQKPSSSLHSTASSPQKTTTANIHSPKTIKQAVGSSQMPPSKFKVPSSSSPPPSPLTLPPPAQLLKTTTTAEEPPKIPPTHHDIEAEPKAMVVQKTIVDNPIPKSWHNELHRESRNHSTNNPPTHHHNNHNNGKETKKEKKVVVSDDHHDHGNMRVITIAGENRGAYMELINSGKKHQPNFLHSKIKEESEESLSEKKKDYEVKGRMRRSSPMAGAAAAYMNSNVQCVNNSLLYHTCFSHHDPGVRLSLSKKPLGLGLGDADDDDDAAAAAARKDRNTTN